MGQVIYVECRTIVQSVQSIISVELGAATCHYPYISSDMTLPK